MIFTKYKELSEKARFTLIDAFGNEMRVSRRAVSPLPENHTWANFTKPSFSPEWRASSRVLSAKDGAVTQHGRSVPERERGIMNSNFAFLGGSCCVCLFCGLSKTTSVQEKLVVEQESRRLVGNNVLSLPFPLEFCWEDLNEIMS